MKSPEASDRIAIAIPTTPEDVAALRRIRERVQPCSAAELNRLSPPEWLAIPPRRRVVAGAEPFRLSGMDPLPRR